MSRIIGLVLLACSTIAARPTCGTAEEPKQSTSNAKPNADDAKASDFRPTDMVAWAESLLKNTEQIESYTTIVVVRERVDDELSEHRHVFLKFRQQPKSFYMYFMGPHQLQGQECLYVADRHEGKMRCRPPSGVYGCIGTVHLHPRSVLATKGLLCPLDLLNIRDLTQRAIDYLKGKAVDGTSEVRQFKEAKINGRVSTVFELKHQTPTPSLGDNPPAYLCMRLFADDELKILNRFEVYEGTSANDSQIRAEYTFLAPHTIMSDPGQKGKVAGINVAAQLTDADFDESNPSYSFRSTRTHDDAIRDKYRAELEQKKSQPVDGKPHVEKKPEPTESASNCSCRRRGRWRR